MQPNWIRLGHEVLSVLVAEFGLFVGAIDSFGGGLDFDSWRAGKSRRQEDFRSLAE